MRYGIVVPVILLAACRASAEPAASKDPRELLNRASQAASKLSAISYTATLHGEGALASTVPRLTAQVVARRGASSGSHQVRIEATMMLPQQTPPPGGNHSTEENVVETIRYVNNGQDVFLMEEGKKQLTSGPVRDAPNTVFNAFFPEMKYLAEKPFRDELRANQLIYNGTEKVEGVDCDVVAVQYDASGARTAKIYVGAQDHLVRRVDDNAPYRVVGQTEVVYGQVVFTAAGLQTRPKIDDKLFSLDCPPGFRQEKFKPAPPPMPGAIGSAAPDFELKNAHGQTVSLKSLRGKVVVLDFWATWCGPCRMAMPGLQKLHERFKGKPVVVYGMNCWERGGNPMDFVKSRNYTYPQFLKADPAAAAYGITGIPTIVAIDQNGKTLFRMNGFDPSLEDRLGAIIEDALKK